MGRSVPAQTLHALQEVDAELLCAFATDWSERIGAYGKQILAVHVGPF